MLLAAAKVLGNEGKLEEAIACTGEVRSLADRHSAMPGGSSGVASRVSQEAFKLEVMPQKNTRRASLILLSERTVQLSVELAYDAETSDTVHDHLARMKGQRKCR